MGKVWVLDTGTSGTGAQMVPLEKALRRSETWRLLTSREQSLLWELRRRPRAPEPRPEEPRQPR